MPAPGGAVGANVSQNWVGREEGAEVGATAIGVSVGVLVVSGLRASASGNVSSVNSKIAGLGAGKRSKIATVACATFSPRTDRP